MKRCMVYNGVIIFKEGQFDGNVGKLVDNHSKRHIVYVASNGIRSNDFSNTSLCHNDLNAPPTRVFVLKLLSSCLFIVVFLLPFLGKNRSNNHLSKFLILNRSIS